MLWDPAAHEPLVQDAWDEVRTRAAIRAIVADAEDAYDDGWPPHPDDAGPGDPGPWGGLYLGGPGVVDALRRLAKRGFVQLRRDYLPYVDTLEPESAGPSLLMGEAGVLLVRHRLEPSAATLERFRELVASNVGDAHRELLWGSPGTMLVARELGFDDLWLHSSELAARETVDAEPLRRRAPVPRRGPWVRRLRARVGRRRRSGRDGATPRRPRGRRGELAAPGRRRARAQRDRPRPVVPRCARDDHVPRVAARRGSRGRRRRADLARRGGREGRRSLPRNGRQRLRVSGLFERTGDGRWLERARRFAAHALVQVEKAQAEHGMGRYSLWTGDLGTALFLADCLDGRGTLPLP
jgi:hypothetical protein